MAHLTVDPIPTTPGDSYLLRVLGASPDTLDQLPAKLANKRRRHDETVADLIDAKLLAVGGGLHPMETKFTTVATVLPDGGLEIGDVIYKAVSEAATAVAGSNRNGWEFWGVPSGSGSLVSLATLRSRFAKDKVNTPPALTATPTGVIAPPVSTSSKPAVPPAASPKPAATSSGKGRKRSDKEKATSLADLVDGGALEAPVMMRASFRGETLEATVEHDGSVLLDGEHHTISGAGRTAKASLVGWGARPGVLATDGWVFWRAQDESGEWVQMEELRRRYVEQLGPDPS